jgi:hypothetical protein
MDAISYPQWPWSLTGLTTFLERQSTSVGRSETGFITKSFGICFWYLGTWLLATPLDRPLNAYDNTSEILGQAPNCDCTYLHLGGGQGRELIDSLLPGLAGSIMSNHAGKLLGEQPLSHLVLRGASDHAKTEVLDILLEGVGVQGVEGRAGGSDTAEATGT